MTKNFDLATLTESETIPSSSDYFLFMLGTGTQFVKEPTINDTDPTTKKYYEKGETLSYTAQVVTAALGENGSILQDPNSPHSFSAPSADVINGPTNLGSEVGDRIARGVFLILKAITEGKDNITISAHSRGSVESILIDHEIKRIKATLKSHPQKSLLDILKESPCSYTSTAFALIFKNQTPGITNDRLSGLLDKTKMNLFLIDPVPGGRKFMVPGIRWQDERFYQELSSKNVDLMLCRDERSCCFIPIVPKGVEPILLPGHHGTPSGNRYDQSYSGLLENGDPSTSQYLVLARLLYFIKHNTTALNDVKKPLDLKHTDLDTVTNKVIDAKTQKNKYLLELYSNAYVNDEVFKTYHITNYSGLGKESSSSGQRYVHYKEHNYLSMDAVVPFVKGFFNPEHANLYFQVSTDLELDEESSDLTKAVVHLKAGLLNLFTAYEKGQRKQGDTKLFDLMSNAETCGKVIEAISSSVQNLNQIYLRNHLTPEDKIELFKSLRSLFDTLPNMYDQESSLGKIVQQVMTIIQQGIHTTAITHWNDLKNQLSYFDELLKLRSPARLKEQVDTLNQQLALTGLGNYQVKNINSLDSITEPDRTKVEELIKAHCPKLPACFDALSRDPNELLQQLNAIYENITSFIEGADSVRKLIAPTRLDINTLELKGLRLEAVELGGSLLKQENRLIDSQNTGLKFNKDFLASINADALIKGVKNPKEGALEHQLGENHNSLMQLNSPKEIRANLHIRKTLMPATLEYLKNLHAKAKKLNPALSNHFQAIIPTSTDAELQKIKIKHDIILESFKLLDYPTHQKLPSERIHDFGNLLASKTKALHLHRSPDWKWHLKNCAIAFAIIATGIIPVLFSFACYAIARKESLFFFAKSDGARHEEQMQREVKNFTQKC